MSASPPLTLLHGMKRSGNHALVNWLQPMLGAAFHNNAMPVTDHLGGGENIRSKDFLAIHHSPELFLGALILGEPITGIQLAGTALVLAGIYLLSKKRA